MEFAPEVLALCTFAFLAGFMDAVVGGGGLIQIPALFVLLPEIAPATLLGTNKFASIFGTASATVHYLRRVPIAWPATVPTACAALICSFLGARTASALPVQVFRPLILALLVGVLVYTLWKKDLGRLHAPHLEPARQLWFALATGATIGFYDGLFGPGTGSFLVIAFVGLFGLGFLAASASAKLVNVITNLAALVYFIGAGHVRYDIAAPMAAFNVAGSLVGTTLAIRKGDAFVRHFFIAVVVLMILRFAWDIGRSA